LTNAARCRRLDGVTIRRTFALSVHADYACAHTAACCAAGWQIPVETRIYRRLADSLASGRLRAGPTGPEAGGAPAVATLLPRDGLALAPGCSAVLGCAPNGACAFLVPAASHRCAIHRHLGADALPVSCREFPRVSLIDGRGTFISLSHFCPTAARKLCRDEVRLAIVENPVAFPPGVHYDGLDAREALPPLLRPDALHTLDSYARWEALAVDTLARPDLSPEEALALLAHAAERLRAWSAAAGTLVDHVDSLRAWVDETGTRDRLAWCDPGRARRAYALAVSAVPAPHRPAAVTHGEDTWSSRAEDAWTSRRDTIARYLAARAFGTWVAYQGRGARSYVAWLALVLGVLRRAFVRAMAASPRGRDSLLEAIRQADLLLVHLADPQALADTVSAAESRRLPLEAGSAP
jgi:hypothetical protein